MRCEEAGDLLPASFCVYNEPSTDLCLHKNLYLANVHHRADRRDGAGMEAFMRNTDKKKENKVLMSMRISAEDKEQIEEKARKTGLSTSEYIRRS